VRLRDLHPELRRGPPVWGSTAVFAEASSIEFDCPGCVGTPWHHRIWAPFLGKYETNGAAWSAVGESIDTLSFVDVPNHSRSIRVTSGCCAHFNVTAGAIDFYGDSGHTKPREKPVSETTEPQAETTDPAGETPAVHVPTPPAIADTAPVGYLKSMFLHFFDGVLHQRHDAPHSGQVPTEVWVPVSGQETPAKTTDAAST
jgi:hypothetical protein